MFVATWRSTEATVQQSSHSDTTMKNKYASYPDQRISPHAC